MKREVSSLKSCVFSMLTIVPSIWWVSMFSEILNAASPDIAVKCPIPHDLFFMTFIFWYIGAVLFGMDLKLKISKVRNIILTCYWTAMGVGGCIISILYKVYICQLFAVIFFLAAIIKCYDVKKGPIEKEEP